MKINAAPLLSLLADDDTRDCIIDNFFLQLPTYVVINVTREWEEYVLNELLEELPYEKCHLFLQNGFDVYEPQKKAEYLKVYQDGNMIDTDSESRQAIYDLYLSGDSKRVFIGFLNDILEFEAVSDKKPKRIFNYNPKSKGFNDFLKGFEPKLVPKHMYIKLMRGNKISSPFSAYDHHNDAYAIELLRRAYLEHDGDVDDRTYLYTFDAKYNTFVEFRPDRNREYHGMDISIEDARKKAPAIVAQYHK